jgi:trk system potassium uptake protein TrkA
MKQFAVIGLGKFGIKVALTLSEKGGQVLVVDEDIRKVEEIKDLVSQAVCLDSTDEDAMRAAGLEDVDAAIVGAGGNIEHSILTTAILKKLGVPHIVARASSDLHAQILERVGATRIINVEEQMGVQVARGIIAPAIQEQFALATGHSLAEVVPRPELIGQSIGKINFRQTYGVNIIAIQKRVPMVTPEGANAFRTEINDLPKPTDVIEEDDVLVVVGSDENIERLARGEA